MLYRSTQQTTTSTAMRYVAHYNKQIAQYQNHISSGIKLHRSSDDPVAYRQVSSLTTQLQQLQTEAYAIVDAETKLNTSVSSIQQSHDLLVRAKTLAQQGIQATSQSERNALAVEVEGLLVSLKDVSKSQSAGSFIYSGTKSDQQPFKFGDPLVPGATIVADYLGSSDQSNAVIGRNISVATFYSGEEIFNNSNRQEMLVFGNTGVKDSPGTDSITGRADLIIEHTATNYTPGSGVAPGTDSVSGDTVIGPPGSNSITINDTSGTGTSGTVVLNNGSEVAWTNADGNLRVEGEDGRAVYLDMTAITPGFSGQVPFGSDGDVSVDGGATKTPIDFSGSQTIVDSTTGGQVHIDTSGVSRTGVDHLEFPGTSNAFQVLHELALDLRNTRELDNNDYSQSIDRRLGELTGLADQSLAILGQQSSSLQTLQELEFRVQDLQLETETQLNNFQATDIPETVLRLQNDQSLLQFTYSVTAQIASTSILDFLR